MALRAVGLRRVQRGDTFGRVHPEFDIGIAVGFGCHRHNPASRQRRTATPALDHGRWDPVLGLGGYTSQSAE